MQVRGRRGGALGAAVLAVVLARPCGAVPLPFDESALHSMMRVFTDSDRVTVRSLTGEWSGAALEKGSLSIHWNHERVRIPGISAPAGSPEAVDAITTASRPIAGDAHRDFEKLRHELEGKLARGPAALHYYVSQERDYLAQMIGANWNRDLEARQLNLSFGSSVAWDDIRPLQDDDTQTAADVKTTLHGNVVATQILSPTTLLRWGVEYNLVSGLQHNPYRNVYAGGARVPERHPDHRQRRDTYLKLNQYLPNRSSLKLNYRFYHDDWGVSSHEVGTSLSQYVTSGVAARYSYRWYTQTAARFHRDEYATAGGVDGFLSGDYRLGELDSHLFGVSLHLDMDALAVAHPLLRRLGLWVNYERYFNSNNYSANILETGLDVRLR